MTLVKPPMPGKPVGFRLRSRELLNVVAHDRQQATSALANFRKKVGGRPVKIAPLVARLIDPRWWRRCGRRQQMPTALTFSLTAFGRTYAFSSATNATSSADTGNSDIDLVANNSEQLDSILFADGVTLDASNSVTPFVTSATLA